MVGPLTANLRRKYYLKMSSEIMNHINASEHTREHAEYRVLSPRQKLRIELEVKMMLHAHRDCLRNRGRDTTKISFDINDGYYGEAFGIMRALAVLGYGNTFGAINVDKPGNLKFWFTKLCDQVLAEENFGGNNECDHCLERYRKDGVRTRPWSG